MCFFRPNPFYASNNPLERFLADLGDGYPLLRFNPSHYPNMPDLFVGPAEWAVVSDALERLGESGLGPAAGNHAARANPAQPGHQTQSQRNANLLTHDPTCKKGIIQLPLWYARRPGPANRKNCSTFAGRTLFGAFTGVMPGWPCAATPVTATRCHQPWRQAASRCSANCQLARFMNASTHWLRRFWYCR